MNRVDELINRYVEESGNLSPEDFDALLAALREEPAAAVRLREQLTLDDLLAQKLTVDRRYFLAQVEQRIADYERGQEEIDSQVADLRAIAETEIERPKPATGLSLWMNLLLVAAACGLIAAVFIAPGYFQQGRAVARVESIDGRATIAVDEQTTRTLQAGDSIVTGKQVQVDEGSTLVLVYVDRTRVDVSGASIVLASEPTTQAKRVEIASGEVAADVAKQSSGAMLFRTPHAVATVLGTSLRITVGDHGTRLDVTKGQVQFQPVGGNDPPVLVGASETSEVRGEELLPLRQLTWPDDRESVVFIFEGADELTLARNPATGNFRDTPLEPHGSVEYTPTGAMQMTGGLFTSADGGADVAALVRNSSQLTVEAIVAPQRARAKGSIVAMAFSNGRGNMQLGQDGDEVVFHLQTERTGQGPEKLVLGKAAPDTETHVAVSYRDGMLCGYLNGKETVRREDVHGSLGNWTDGVLAVGGDSAGGRAWRGTVAGLAIHNRALEEVEIARNARNFRSLNGSLDGPRWQSLMNAADPASHVSAGTWSTVDDAWESAGSGERLSFAPVKGSYDLRFELHLLEGGGEPIELLLPVGNRHVSAVLQGAGAMSKHHGLDLIDLVPASENASGSAGQLLELHRIYNIEARVRIEGTDASITVTVDGQPWVEWSGPRESLSLRTEKQDWAEPAPVLSVGNRRVQVHSMKLRQSP